MKRSKYWVMALLAILVLVLAACGGTGEAGNGAGSTSQGDATGSDSTMMTGTPGADDLGLGDTGAMTDTTDAGATDTGAGSANMGTPGAGTGSGDTGTTQDNQGSGMMATGTPEVGNAQATPDPGAGSDTGSGSDMGAGSAGMGSAAWTSMGFMDAFGFLADEGFQVNDVASGEQGQGEQTLSGAYAGCDYDIVFSSPADDNFTSLSEWVQSDLADFDEQASMDDVRFFTYNGSAGGLGNGSDASGSGSSTGSGTDTGSGTGTGNNSGAGMGQSDTVRGEYQVAIWMSGEDSDSPTARIYLWRGSALGNQGNSGSDTSGAGTGSGSDTGNSGSGNSGSDNSGSGLGSGSTEFQGSERARVATISFAPNSDCDYGDLESFVDYLVGQASFEETEGAGF